MPIYMDTHAGAELPAELRRTIESRVTSSERDEFGVMDRGIIMDTQANEMHCVLDAPDVDAVLKHHESVGVPVETSAVHLADAILK